MDYQTMVRMVNSALKKAAETAKEYDEREAFYTLFSKLQKIVNEA